MYRIDRRVKAHLPYPTTEAQGLDPDSRFLLWKEIPVSECSGDFSNDSALISRLADLQTLELGHKPRIHNIELWFVPPSPSLQCLRVRGRRVSEFIAPEGPIRACDYEVETLDGTKVIAAFRIQWR